jgi:hypothetical protein
MADEREDQVASGGIADDTNDDYNYAIFRGQEDFAGLARAHHVGERAPDATLTRLDDGGAVRLSDLWRAGNVILEFGSYS